ncbi:MAG: hypothetical protein IPI59_05300 [Sphingobacteriales bacterium]|jgi:cobalamin biosynthesis protein CobD/CbiB|nr:hypothetical protein [Sphingobacteriales bacterium]MBP9140808.1 hypothetical protein [Chitinophagales bacterium]MDA0198348.1 hypothetical protein [Bacteroidota bacterium]MBK6891210.1 hypothetical protein [Sphingobacteriales bacterium]MBK7526965.1 hypothetical protein [Sphingobacteriales bacterium]
MKAKFLNLLLIISSLFGYLEWGAGNKTFLFEGEYEVLSKLFTDPKSVVHPFTLLPLLGQILLLLTLFQKNPSKTMTYVGIACLGVLLGLMFFIGIMALNFKILISTLPFLLISFYTIMYWRVTSALSTPERKNKV